LDTAYSAASFNIDCKWSCLRPFARNLQLSLYWWPDQE